MLSSMLEKVCAEIGRARGCSFTAHVATAVAGGCIHGAWRVADDTDAYFVKTGAATRGVFAAEAAGLHALAATRTVAVPRPLAWADGETAFLVLPWLCLNGPADPYQLGTALAALHAAPAADRFGFETDNFIGATPQENGWCDDWATFFVTRRLQPQFARAREAGLACGDADAVSALAGEILADHDVRPRLVHGDLWQGNLGYQADGTPTLFDPAAYYGDPEVDLAMLTLFGRPEPTFYDGYHARRRPKPGAELRAVLYNLYHVLNHANLFGGSYPEQARRMARRLRTAC